MSASGIILAAALGFSVQYAIGAAVLIVIPAILGTFLLREPGRLLVGSFVRRLKAYVLGALVGGFIEAATLAVHAPKSWAAFRVLGSPLGWRECVWLVVGCGLLAEAVAVAWSLLHLGKPTLAEWEGQIE